MLKKKQRKREKEKKEIPKIKNSLSLFFLCFYIQGLLLSCSDPKAVTDVINCVDFHFSSSVMSDSFQPRTSCMPGFPVHHQLRVIAQTHVHRVGDAIQPPHPLLSPSPAFSLPKHQGCFQGVSSSHQVDKVLKFQLQHQSFQ